MGLRLDMAKTLLLMVLMTSICSEAALLRKSAAADFLSHSRRERSSPEVSVEDDSDSEAEELLEANSDYDENFKELLNGGSNLGKNSSPESDAVKEEGSGM